MKEQLPYIPWYHGDFLKATMGWTIIERFSYFMLLCSEWESGPLPSEPERLALIVGCYPDEFLVIWKQQLARKFIKNADGRLINERLEAHRAKHLAYREMKSKSGKEGALSKWRDLSAAVGEPHAKRSRRLERARQLGTHDRATWLALIEVCGRSCVKCGIPMSELYGNTICKDHVVPIYQGGSDGIENLQPLCRNCNSSKGPERVDYRPPDWRERLALVLGKSPGKAN